LISDSIRRSLDRDGSDIAMEIPQPFAAVENAARATRAVNSEAAPSISVAWVLTRETK
jgi:hypothetical protein